MNPTPEALAAADEEIEAMKPVDRAADAVCGAMRTAMAGFGITWYPDTSRPTIRAIIQYAVDLDAAIANRAISSQASEIERLEANLSAASGALEKIAGDWLPSESAGVRARQKIAKEALEFISTPDPTPAGAWRPIEEAPKDGFFIDLFNGHERLTGCWFSRRRDAFVRWSAPDLNGETYEEEVSATHFMIPIPLPQPPSPDER